MSGSVLLKSSLMELTAAIATAYVGKNVVSVGELPDLIKSISNALAGDAAHEKHQVRPRTPAVPIKKSVTDDYVICLEDGERFRSLKEHLRVRHKLSAAEYRARWGLAIDYPMTAPAYSAVRVQLAKSMGLGRKGSHKRRKLSSQSPHSTSSESFEAAASQRPNTD